MACHSSSLPVSATTRPVRVHGVRACGAAGLTARTRLQRRSNFLTFVAERNTPTDLPSDHEEIRSLDATLQQWLAGLLVFLAGGLPD